MLNRRAMRCLVVLMGGLGLVGLILSGCGGTGSPGSGGGALDPTPPDDGPGTGGPVTLAQTEFRVNVTTGEVTVTPADTGEVSTQAVLGGDALVYTSSRLLDQGGSPGRRVLEVRLTNRSGEALGSDRGIRVLFGDILANDDVPSVSSYVTVSTVTQMASGYDPWSIAVAPDGSFFVGTETSRIYRVYWNGGNPTSSASYTANAIFTGAGAADGSYGIIQGLTITDNGVIYASCSDHVILRGVFLGGDPRLVASYAWDVIAGSEGTANSTDGSGDLARFSSPTGICLDETGAVIVSDYSNHRLRRVSLTGADPDAATDWTVSTIAGSASGFEDAVGSTALFQNPYDVAADPTVSDAFFVADYNNSAVRRVTFDGSDRDDAADYTVTTIAGDDSATSHEGSGEEAELDEPRGIVVDEGGTIYVTQEPDVAGEAAVQRVRYTGSGDRDDRTRYVLEDVVDGGYGDTDGAGNVAEMRMPTGIVVGQDGALYVADQHSNNRTVRRVTAPPATITDGNEPPGNANGSPTVSLVEPTGVMPGGVKYIAYRALTDDDSAIEDWNFNIPEGVHTFRFTVRALADTEHAAYPQRYEGEVVTLAGVAGATGCVDGPVSIARFYSPRFAAVGGGGAIFVSDDLNHRIRRIDPEDGEVTTIAGREAAHVNGTGAVARLNRPQGLCYAGNAVLFVADTLNHTIRRLAEPSDGDPGEATNYTLYTIAGSGSAGYGDGSGAVAQFSSPTDVAALDGRTVFVADQNNNCIRRLTLEGADPDLRSEWNVTTLAGTTSAGTADGTGTSARFNRPGALAISRSGYLYVYDFGSNRIRKVSPAGEVTTLVSAGLTGDGDVAVDDADTVYISDAGAGEILRLRAGGSLEILAGTGTVGDDDGPASTATFSSPWGLYLGLDGTLVIVDSGGSTIRTLERSIVSKSPSG